MTVGIGLAPGDISLDLGPFHPVSHGGFQLQLELDQDVITSASPRIGFMHRGAEKLFEVRDYRQIMMLANRHDWLAPFASELGVALTLESAMGITPPARSTWIRMLMAELTRMSAHLAFLAGSVDQDSALAAREARERIAQWMEDVTGNRVHPMYARIGGVAHDLPEGALDSAQSIANTCVSILPAAREAILAAGIGGLATLSTEDALSFGSSGPVGHASGLANDTRFTTAYMFYSQLDGQTVAQTANVPHAGDAESRFLQLISQIELSTQIIQECIPHLHASQGEPVNVVLPKVVRAPEGTNYSWSEGPTGINGWLLVSAGEKTPWRLKLRAASFNNLQAIAHALTGTPLDQLAEAVKSSFIVIGDVDR
jgi:NADH-quinone oxidoreductase subunit D